MTQRYGDYYGGGGLAIEEPTAKRPRLDQWQSEYTPEYIPPLPEVYSVSHSDGFGGVIHQDATLEGSWINYLADRFQVPDISNPSALNSTFIPITEREHVYHAQSHSPWDLSELQDQNTDWAYQNVYQRNSSVRSVGERGEVLVDETTLTPTDQVCFGMVSYLKSI